MGTNNAVLSSQDYISQARTSFNNIEDGYYISPAFLDKMTVHVAKNFMNLPKIKVPLILGIWGGKGQGKTFQVSGATLLFVSSTEYLVVLRVDVVKQGSKACSTYSYELHVPTCRNVCTHSSKCVVVGVSCSSLHSLTKAWDWQGNCLSGSPFELQRIMICCMSIT